MRASEINSIEEILSIWKYVVDRLDAEVVPGKAFLEIRVKNKGNSFDLGEDIDWWPKTEVLKRTDILTEYGIYAPNYWTTYKGTKYTAEYLYASPDPNMWGLILIKAFVKDRIDSLPDNWRGGPYTLLNKLENIIYDHSKEIHWPHGCRRTLPVTALKAYYLQNYVIPKDLGILIQLAAIDATLSLSTWQLVRIIGEN